MQREGKLESRSNQLLALENIILSRSLNEAIRPEGRPVAEGHISSYFGERQDPFDGTEAWHRGVDFAGALGSQVLSVAAGVVTKSEPHSGYGNLIEINHGNGFMTRYAHNAALAGAGGRHGGARPAHRPDGLHWPFHRAACALRSAAQRPADQSAVLRRPLKRVDPALRTRQVACRYRKMTSYPPAGLKYGRSPSVCPTA